MNETNAMRQADKIYGRSNLLKLTPELKMATISVLLAILEVKKTAAINTNNGVNRLAKCGIKLR
jgi:hypothetical protein